MNFDYYILFFIVILFPLVLYIIGNRYYKSYNLYILVIAMLLFSSVINSIETENLVLKNPKVYMSDSSINLEYRFEDEMMVMKIYRVDI